MSDQNDVAAAKKSKEAAERDKEADKLAEAIEKRAEARVREASPSDDDNKRIGEIIALFDDLERRRVLSYRIDAPAVGRPRVLQFAIKGGQPIIVTISSNKVRFEKLQPNGSREATNDLGISNPDKLTRNNMKAAINRLLEK